MLTQESAEATRRRGSELPRRAGVDTASKRSHRRAAGCWVLAVLSVGLALWVAPIDDVFGGLDGVDPLWLIAAIGLECRRAEIGLGYV